MYLFLDCYIFILVIPCIYLYIYTHKHINSHTSTYTQCEKDSGILVQILNMISCISLRTNALFSQPSNGKIVGQIAVKLWFSNRSRKILNSNQLYSAYKLTMNPILLVPEVLGKHAYTQNMSQKYPGTLNISYFSTFLFNCVWGGGKHIASVLYTFPIIQSRCGFLQLINRRWD